MDIDINQTLKKFDLLMDLENTQRALNLREKQLKEYESKLMENENEVKSKMHQLEIQQNNLKLESMKHREDLKLLNTERDLIEMKRAQQLQQLALILMQREENTKYAKRLQMRENNLLQRESELLQKEHNLHQKEKELELSRMQIKYKSVVNNTNNTRVNVE